MALRPGGLLAFLIYESLPFLCEKDYFSCQGTSSNTDPNIVWVKACSFQRLKPAYRLQLCFFANPMAVSMYLLSFIFLYLPYYRILDLKSQLWRFHPLK